ncbi:MAG: C4-dicarboxylate TRAP transporter substrate-binding protein [Pseudomonadota bacterium]|nr:C4-dicarboxylate TRAP transporter substrate-binding protein [Pseudomonadota bacterium]
MRNLTSRVLALASAAVVGMSVLTGQAQARDLRYALGLPPGALPVQGAEMFAKAVEENSGGDLTVTVYALSLLNIPETSPGLRDGIADIGLVLTPYYPAEYPHINIIAESSMMLSLLGDQVRGREAMVFVPAMTEFLMTACPECQQEFQAQNQVFTGVLGGAPYSLLCNTPVATLADLQGKRMRVGAANWSRWVSELGGTPVTMSGNEMMEALSQGVVDCIVASVPEIDNFNLGEAVSDVTTGIPGGIFTTSGQNVNLSVWQDLTPDQREAFLRAASDVMAWEGYSYHEAEDAVTTRLEGEGVNFHAPADDLIAATEGFVESDLEAMAEYFQSNHGVERGAEMLDQFRQLLDKWVTLTEGAETIDDFEQLYWSELFSAVDTEAYGL